MAGGDVVAIVGGTGLDRLEGLHIREARAVSTPYGEPSAPLQLGRLEGCEVCFLARHGDTHHLPPHRINYRANLWALRDAGAGWVFAVAAVGGIRADLGPGAIVVPDQIVDYTWGRESTFHEPPESEVVHIDFTRPYAHQAREMLLRGAGRARVGVTDGGVYGATQGPRLETAAEIDRLERDGCDVVGMTGMPEAALAREAGLRYAALALVVNAAAGRTEGEITMQGIRAVLDAGMGRVRRVLAQAVREVAAGSG